MPAAMSSVKLSRPIWSSTTDGSMPRSGQRRHGPDEVVALADHPAGAHDVVPGHHADDGVAGGLGLAVDAERGHRLDLVVRGVAVPSKT